MNKQRIALAATIAALLAGCAARSPIGVIDVQRIVANWPVFQADQSQLNDAEQRIAASKVSLAEKRREAIALQNKYAGVTKSLTDQVRQAAEKIAQAQQLQLVVTRDGVGYGGTDITAQVEKALNITEKATPTPSS